MQGHGLGWGEDFRPLQRQALTEVIEGRMAESVDRWLDGLAFEESPIGATVIIGDRTSMDRTFFAVFMHENKMQGLSAPFLVTQNNCRYRGMPG